MVRLCLIIILIGGLIGALLPSGRDSPVASSSERPLLIRSDAERDDSRDAGPQQSAFGPSTRIEKGPGGHYYADAQVNGTTIHFVIDTGSTGVALTRADAQRAGMQFLPSEFSVIGSGASGPVRGKLVTIDRVTLGGKTVERVDGAILESSEISLLGQSFLNRLGSVEMSGDYMVLK
jgi:aspartyl protease family protein